MRMQGVKDTIEQLRKLIERDNQANMQQSNSESNSLIELAKLEILQATLLLKFCMMQPNLVKWLIERLTAVRGSLEMQSIYMARCDLLIARL